MSLRQRLRLSATDLTETSGHSKPQLGFIQKLILITTPGCFAFFLLAKLMARRAGGGGTEEGERALMADSGQT